jgi:hypothetical protein
MRNAIRLGKINDLAGNQDSNDAGPAEHRRID